MHECNLWIKEIIIISIQWNQLLKVFLSIHIRSKLVLFTNLLSPAIRIGWCALNATWFNLAFFRDTTCCEQIGWYLSTLISKTWTFPSTVTAANTVLEKGAQATSPTCEFKSNMKIGFLKYIKNTTIHGKNLFKLRKTYRSNSNNIYIWPNRRYSSDFFDLTLISGSRFLPSTQQRTWWKWLEHKHSKLYCILEHCVLYSSPKMCCIRLYICRQSLLLFR